MQTEKNRSVLVLEDDPHWQKVVTQILRKVDGDLDVNCVAGTKEAHSLLSSGSRYDLIIADHFLDGEKTGLDFFHDLRDKQDRTSFVLVSSLDRDVFGLLKDSETETPQFVAKTEATRMLSEVVCAKLGEMTLPIEDVEAISSVHDLKFLAIFVVSALSLVSIQLQMTKASNMTGGSWQPMNPTKLHPLAQPVVDQPAVVKVPLVKTHARFVTPQLQAQIARITHRAEAIDKDVVKHAALESPSK